MVRHRKGNKINGWLVIDKPLGMTSSQVVSKVKWLLKAQKVGHAGTLDPLATGVLPIGLGEATKTMPFIVDSSKTYSFTISIGSATNTDDREGEVVTTSNIRPSRADIENILPDFIGEIEQVPPAYSAIKIDGKRAYALARDGQEVKMKARQVNIYKLQLLSLNEDLSEATFEVTCGKGTYVRSLGRDIAHKLGTCGHISMLRRIRVGPFDVSHTISLEKLEDLGHSAPAESYVLSVMTALADIPAFAITETEAIRVRCGNPVPVREELSDLASTQGPLCLMMDGSPLAIAKVIDGMVQPLRVFNM